LGETLKKIKIIHGPNLNLLGQREPELYGKATLESINHNLELLAESLGVRISFFQSNHEGDLVEAIQQAASECDAIVINPAAYTHTSVAIRDALSAVDVPAVEVHLSNIYKREDFRKNSLTSPVVSGQICGLGEESYYLGLRAAVSLAVNR
jgi:3-dehydroquinate dehydratase II